MRYQICGNALNFEDGSRIEFDDNIKELIGIGLKLVVVLDVLPTRSMTENVFGVSGETGTLIWQLERIAATGTNPANRYEGFVGFGQNGLQVYNWNGDLVEIDPDTGKVLSTRFVK